MTESSNGSPNGSKGVAFTNWLVSKASGVLERKSSRRGFILGSAMVGSAVAVAGCAPGTQPGTPYSHITDCGGGLCTDGYTEFCCTINNGANVCPPGTFVAGWWRADYSSFCNGTRYYMDCNESCCGPNLGNGFCAGCHEARCAGGCDTRRVYANYFRYGQCHQEIGALGPIACRLVTCSPPYTVAEGTRAPLRSRSTTPPLSTLPRTAAPRPRRSPRLFSMRPCSRSQVQQLRSGVATSDSSDAVPIRGCPTPSSTDRPGDPTWTSEVLSAPASPRSRMLPATTSLRGARPTTRSGTNGTPAVAGQPNGRRWLGTSYRTRRRSAIRLDCSSSCRGSDDAIWCNRATSGSFGGFASLGGVADLRSVAARDGTGVYVFVRGLDNGVLPTVRGGHLVGLGFPRWHR